MGVATPCGGGSADLAADGPIIAWPQQIVPVGLGNSLRVNGMPVRVQAFVSSARPDEVAAWFRRSLGKPLLEMRLEGQLVLGRLQGGHYVTVQIEPAGRGTRGLLAVSDLRAGEQTGAEHRSQAAQWLARWPAGSQLYSHVTSRDGERLSRHTVVVNGHDESVNAERLRALLAEEGYVFEREARQDEGAAGPVLFFRGAGGDAIATIHRDPAGRSVVVLNTVSRTERTP